jgi:methyl-accepting chemotaxis protein
MGIVSKWFGSIRSRLLVGSLGLAIIPVLLTVLALGYFSYREGSRALEARAVEQMRSLESTATSVVQAYFGGVASNLNVVKAAPEIRAGVADLKKAIAEITQTVAVERVTPDSLLVDYYQNAFTAEYAKRNANATVDMATRLADQDAVAIALQQAYVAANRYPLGEKYQLQNSASLPAYDLVHERLQGFVRTLKDEYGYYDVFLVNPEDGRVMYTYFKELDFGTSLIDGPWADSGLGEAFAMAKDATDETAMVMSDFRPYLPSYEDQAAFVATPVYDKGQRIAILIVQLPVDRLNSALNFGGKWSTVGLGASGEIYLVGGDTKPRSDSRFLVENPAAFGAALTAIGLPKDQVDLALRKKSNIGVNPIDTQATRTALRQKDGKPGSSGVGSYPDYRGVPVLGAYSPLNVFGNDWALISEIDQAEALQSVLALRSALINFAVITLLLMVVIGVVVARMLAGSINRPIAHLQGTVKEVNDGDLDARTRMTSPDELGQLGRAFDNMLDERVATLARAEKENEQLNNSVIDLMGSLAQLSQRDLTIKVPVSADITGAVSDAINMVTGETASALKQVLAISGEVAQASNSVKTRSDDVTRATEASGQQVAEASIELTAAARALTQIAGMTAQATRDAEQALSATQLALASVRSTVEGISSSRDQIRETEKRVKRLGERSQEISSVVGIINQIAERTSVLALNASMQAVAAGDAGRGFAVVADEVKRLAENARQATQQISSLVSGIQADTQETIQAMNNTITQVVDISRIAEQAGARMNETRTSTDGLVTSVRDIANTTKAQEALSQTLLNRTRLIQNATLEALNQVSEQGKETSNLLTYSSRLLETVRKFKLPS